MPNPIVIDKAHARRFLLGHIRLLPPSLLHGKQGVIDYIRNLALSLNLAFVWKRLLNDSHQAAIPYIPTQV